MIVITIIVYIIDNNLKYIIKYILLKINSILEDNSNCMNEYKLTIQRKENLLNVI